MITAAKAALTLLCVLLILAGVTALWQTWQLDTARGRITGLVKAVDSAKADADRWQAAAQAKGVAAAAQADLAAACLKREAQAQADRDSIAGIMATANPQPIPPEQAKQGVDDATRIRAVDMLNRPW